MLTLLEELKQQNQTVILLQQQILKARSDDQQINSEVEAHLPASCLEELQFINTEAKEEHFRAKLV